MTDESLTYDYVNSLFNIDLDTGMITNKIKRGNRLAGIKAGSLDAYGYGCIQINGKIYKSHRIAWLLYYKAWPIKDIDHVNCRKYDNRKSNLREVENIQNLANLEMRINNSSGYKGVCWHKSVKKWIAQINVNGCKYHLGCYLNPKDAALAYDKIAREWFCEFARLNFPLHNEVLAER
jgi:hypothetical protein